MSSPPRPSPARAPCRPPPHLLEVEEDAAALCRRGSGQSRRSGLGGGRGWPLPTALGACLCRTCRRRSLGPSGGRLSRCIDGSSSWRCLLPCRRGLALRRAGSSRRGRRPGDQHLILPKGDEPELPLLVHLHDQACVLYQRHLNCAPARIGGGAWHGGLRSRASSLQGFPGRESFGGSEDDDAKRVDGGGMDASRGKGDSSATVEQAVPGAASSPPG